MTLKRLLLSITALVVLGFSFTFAQDVPVNPAAVADASIHHADRFEEKAKIVAEGNIDLVFIGDSITHFWDTTGKDVQDKYFGLYKRVDLGLGWNGTQHVLWELENIQTDKIQPKAIMLMIGTNNIGWLNQTPEMAIGGIETVVTKIRTLWPNSKLLLLGVFPRGEKPSDPFRVQIKTINDSISKLHDGKNVFYMDIGDKFLNADGVIPRDIMRDFLHPTVKGYEIWAEAVAPTLKAWLNEQ